MCYGTSRVQSFSALKPIHSQSTVPFIPFHYIPSFILAMSMLQLCFPRSGLAIAVLLLHADLINICPNMPESKQSP